MSLNCPHAWEEYKKLDTAHDALRREYLALRGEQSSDNSNEFKNVPKEWLLKMRELRGRCLIFRAETNIFLQEFDENYSSEVPEETKLSILQKKITNNIKLEKRDLRFLYSIGGWPSDETKKSLNNIIQIRDKSKDLSKIFDCREDQISFIDDDFEKGKDIIYHWGDLKFSDVVNAHNLKLPKYIRGNLFLGDLGSGEGLVLPEKIGGCLNLMELTSAEGLVLPEKIGGDLYLNSLESAEGLVLPEKIGGDLYLNSLESAGGLVLPKEIGGCLDLRDLTSAEGLVLPEKIGVVLLLYSLESAEGLLLPEKIGWSLSLESLESAEGLLLPKKISGYLNLSGLSSAEGLVLPKEIGGDLNLSGLTSAKGLVLPEKIGGYLILSSLTSVDGLDLSNCNNIQCIFLGQNLPDSEKDKLCAKYPHLADKIE